MKSDGTVSSYDGYYPFGMVMEGRSMASSGDARYKYLTKERDAETGLDWLEARGYDARIGRFLQIDPLHEISPEYSPYHYAFNNPVRFIDPTGLMGEDNTKKQEEEEPKKTYILPEVVVTAERPSEGTAYAVLLGAAIVQQAPHPAIKVIGGVILAGAATYQFLQPLLTKPYAAENAKEKDKPKTIDQNIDLTNPSTWPIPPTKDLPLRVGDPSRAKPRARGEKSIFDSKGGEWRPHKPDAHHPEGHWDHKPHPSGPWINVPIK